MRTSRSRSGNSCLSPSQSRRAIPGPVSCLQSFHDAWRQVARRLLRFFVNLVIQVELVADRHRAVDRVQAVALLEAVFASASVRKWVPGTLSAYSSRSAPALAAMILRASSRVAGSLDVVDTLVKNLDDLRPVLLALGEAHGVHRKHVIDQAFRVGAGEQLLGSGNLLERLTGNRIPRADGRQRCLTRASAEFHWSPY